MLISLTSIYSAIVTRVLKKSRRFNSRLTQVVSRLRNGQGLASGQAVFGATKSEVQPDMSEYKTLEESGAFLTGIDKRVTSITDLA